MRDVIDSLTDPIVLFVTLFYSIGAFVIIFLTARHQK